MASLDPAEKAKGIEIFRHGIDICAELGWGIVNLVPHWPLGLKAPIPYVPSYIYPIARGAARMPSPKLRMTLPEPFDFDAIWRNYVDSLVIATELAAEREVKLALEGHAHVIVSGTDAMPRLLDEVSNPALVVKTSNAQFKEAGRDLGSSRKTIHSGGRAGWSASRRRPIATGRFVPTMTSSAAGCDGCSSASSLVYRSDRPVKPWLRLARAKPSQARGSFGKLRCSARAGLHLRSSVGAPQDA
jgi:hypothetical protein